MGTERMHFVLAPPGNPGRRIKARAISMGSDGVLLVVILLACCCSCFMALSSLFYVAYRVLNPGYTTILSDVLELDRDEALKAETPKYGKDPIAYTISFWLKIGDPSPQWRNILRVGDVDAVRLPGIWIVPNTRNLWVRHGYNVNETDPPTGTLSSETDWGASVDNTISGWQHVAITLSDKTLKTYLSGVQASSQECPGNPTIPATSTLIMAARPDATSSYIDADHPLSVASVRIYPRTLTATEVVKLAASRPTGLTLNPPD